MKKLRRESVSLVVCSPSRACRGLGYLPRDQARRRPCDDNLLFGALCNVVSMNGRPDEGNGLDRSYLILEAFPLEGHTGGSVPGRSLGGLVLSRASERGMKLVMGGLINAVEIDDLMSNLELAPT